MRLRNRDEPLDPRVERELDAVDRTLAGREVDPELTDWAELTALLSEERPEPAPGWSEELDRRAAEGFREDDHADAWSSLVARLSGIRPMRALAPVGALATAAVVVVVGVSSLSDGGDDAASMDAGAPSGVAAESQELEAESTTATPAPLEQRDAAAGDAAVAQAPTATPESSGAGGASAAGLAAGAIAPGTSKRQVERDVTLALSTRPEDVRDTSDEAIAITRAAGGVVASSQVTEAGRRATATLELTIPTRNLDSALDQLTALANVDALNETTLDITRPFVSAQDQVDDATAERQMLLEALGNAETAAEAEALRLQIDDARREISQAESVFENIARRARLSDVSLSIQANPDAAEEEGEGEAGRTIGGWLDDTVSVLRDVAGVLLVSAAIVVPLGILFAITWFVVTSLRRHRREQALDPA